MGFNRQPAAIITGIGIIIGIVLVAIHADPAFLVATTGIVGAIIHYFVTPVASPVLAPGTPVTTPGGDTANPTLIVAPVHPAIPVGSPGPP